MNMFHARQTNILSLYIINLSVSTSPPSALTVNYAFSMEGSTQYGLQGRAPNPAGLLMTSVITSPLLLTPALKNNIYLVCHHDGGCACLYLCMHRPVFLASDLNDDFHSPFLSGVLLESRHQTWPVCVKQIFLRKSRSRERNTSTEPKPPWSLIIFQLSAT